MARDSLLNSFKLEILFIEGQKMFNLCTKYDIFFQHCGPQGPSYSKLRPAETFSLQMCPSIDLSLRPQS
jgi:hypothetical protein